MSFGGILKQSTRLLLMYGVVACMDATQQPEQQIAIDALFDNPFLTSWYKRSLDTSMQIWSDAQWLLQASQQSVAPQERQLILDAIMGRLAYLNVCIQKMMQHEQQRIKAHDINYLARIIGTLNELCEQLAHKEDPNGRGFCLEQLIKHVQNKFQKSMSVFYSTYSE